MTCPGEVLAGLAIKSCNNSCLFPILDLKVSYFGPSSLSLQHYLDPDPARFCLYQSSIDDEAHFHSLIEQATMIPNTRLFMALTRSSPICLLIVPN